MEEIPKHEANNRPTNPTKWLSHSFDIYQSGAPADINVYEQVFLLDDAIAELAELPGGREAWDLVLQQFEVEHGRKIGDKDAARFQFLQENPKAERYAHSTKFTTDQDVSDKHWLAYRLAETITQTHDPRTPDYLEQYFADHRPEENAFYRQHDIEQVEDYLNIVPEHLREAVLMLTEENRQLTEQNEELRNEIRKLRKRLKDC